MPPEVEPPDRTDPPTRAAVTFAGCLYVAMTAMAMLWLWQRERLQALPQCALGEHGLWVAGAVGLAAGVTGNAALTLVARHSSGVRGCEQRIAAVLGRLDDAAVLMLSLFSAIAEELFFRLAVQDAFGWPAAVAFYVVLNTGPGFLAWMPVALGYGLLFSLMMQSGFGLLSATTAHALVNYLSLRRILP